MSKDVENDFVINLLRGQVTEIMSKETPSEFGNEIFVAMLVEKMEARNVDPRASSYVSENPQYIHSSYDYLDPKQVEILNNKVEQAYALFAELEDRDAALSSSQKEALNLLFGSKH